MGIIRRILSYFDLFDRLKKRGDKIKSWFNKKRLIRLIILIIVGLAISGLIFWRQKNRQPEVELSRAENRDLQETVIASGEIKAAIQVDLKFQASGQLVWVGVKENDRVKAWQAIAQLDKKSLEKQLQQELIDFQKEYRDLEQGQEDYENDIISSDIKRILDDHQNDLDRSVLDVEIKQLAVKYATLVSPISGIVTQVDVPVAGVNVTPTTAGFTVADLDNLVFQANVDEMEIGKLKLGQKVNIILDSYPDEKLELELSEIGYTSTVTSGGGTAFPVKVKLPENNQDKYRLGMNGDIEIIIAERPQILTIPFEAVRQDGDQEYVWLKTASGFEKRPVETGFSTDFYTQITSGLTSGEQVVISGFDQLRNGFGFGND